MKVGLVGRFCSGKDSVADRLCLPRYAFADGLKDEMLAILALHGKAYDRAYVEANKDKFRSFLQVYGTDLIRSFVDENYWVKRLLASISTEDAVVTDVRFQNEVDALRKARFTIVRLEVSRDTQVERYLTKFGDAPKPSQFEHPSEVGIASLLGIDYQVDANKPLDDVVAMVRKVLWPDRVFVGNSEIRPIVWSKRNLATREMCLEPPADGNVGTTNVPELLCRAEGRGIE